MPGFVCTGSGQTYVQTHVCDNNYWPTWVSTASSTYDSPAMTSNGGIWNHWIQDNSVTGATTSVTYWPQWVQQPATRSGNAWITWVNVAEETAEQCANREADEKAQRERWAAEAKERERRTKIDAKRAAAQRRKAQQRAETLLKLALSAAEYSEWRQYRSVRIVGSRGGLYEVGPGPHGAHVYRIKKDGKEVDRICYQPDGRFCGADRVLALVLDLKTCEDNILSRGNARDVSTDKQLVRRLEKRRVFKVLLGGEAA